MLTNTATKDCDILIDEKPQVKSIQSPQPLRRIVMMRKQLLMLPTVMPFFTHPWEIDHRPPVHSQTVYHCRSRSANQSFTKDPD